MQNIDFLFHISCGIVNAPISIVSAKNELDTFSLIFNPLVGFLYFISLLKTGVPEEKMKMLFSGTVQFIILALPFISNIECSSIHLLPPNESKILYNSKINIICHTWMYKFNKANKNVLWNIDCIRTTCIPLWDNFLIH